MKQSDVMKCIYESLCSLLSQVGGTSGSFSVGEMDSGDGKLPVVRVGITDVCQLAFDKSGQRIIVDEKQYEPPAMFAMCVSFSVFGRNYGDVLSALGELVVFFKDNPAVDISEYSWHGNRLEKFFLEPVIRQPVTGKIGQPAGECCLSLEYRIDFSINSRKGISFRRVEKRDLRSNVIK